MPTEYKYSSRAWYLEISIVDTYYNVDMSLKNNKLVKQIFITSPG